MIETCICGCPLERYVITGGRWNEERNDFDTEPQVLEACPNCDRQ